MFQNRIKIATATATLTLAFSLVPMGAAASSTLTSWRTTNYHTTVVNSGEQEQVDACLGGLTLYEPASDWLHKDVYAIHQECGGTPILKLTRLSKIFIDGKQYQMVDEAVVKRGDDTSKIRGLNGDVFLQTCYPNSQNMRIVGLVPVQI